MTNLYVIWQVQQDTAESMSCVVELDRVKSRMISTERRLKQADKWCVLNDQIDNLFEEQVNASSYQFRNWPNFSFIDHNLFIIFRQ